MDKLVGIHLTENSIQHAAELLQVPVGDLNRQLTELMAFDENLGNRVYLVARKYDYVLMIEKTFRENYRFPNGEVLNAFAEVDVV